MKIFNTTREFFWPLLEDSEAQEVKSITVQEINVHKDYLEKTLEYTIKRYEAEEDRKKTVESKASLFIGTISVVTSVVIGITSVLINKNEINATTCFIVFLLFILTVYMARTIWFSIQALERKNYHTISVNDFLIKEANDDYYKSLITEITNKIYKNYAAINDKVDSMTMAQEYFKRSIVVVTLFSFCILIFFLSKIVRSSQLPNLGDFLNHLSMSGWNIIIMYFLIFLCLIFVILGYRNSKRK
jgi:cation transport ATPase